MKGMFIIKDKVTGKIITKIHPWALYILLTHSGVLHVDRETIQIFIDDTEIPMPEGMKDET